VVFGLAPVEHLHMTQKKETRPIRPGMKYFFPDVLDSVLATESYRVITERIHESSIDC
jgi:hypothetical protein